MVPVGGRSMVYGKQEDAALRTCFLSSLELRGEGEGRHRAVAREFPAKGQRDPDGRLVARHGHCWRGTVAGTAAYNFKADDRPVLHQRVRHRRPGAPQFMAGPDVPVESDT